jgi:hypothetical protein
MSGNIFNSNGIQVGVVNGAAIFDLQAKTLQSKRDQYLSADRRVGRTLEWPARLRSAARSLLRQAILSQTLIGEWPPCRS